MKPLFAERGGRRFLLLWAGQLVSLVGSGLIAFALGIWMFQRTGSTTKYALLCFCGTAPPLFVLPLVGPLVDRWDRKRLLIACDLLAAGATGAVGVLAWRGALSFAAACVLASLTACAAAVQWPTWAAMVPMLVSRAQLGRANGLFHLAHATTQVLAPLLAGTLTTVIGLAGIAAVDFLTFAVSTATLLAVAVPRLASTGTARRSYWADVPFGVRYIRGREGLLALLLMFAAVNFFAELAAVLFAPLVLSFSTAATLGAILAAGGLGMVAGGAVMSVWGGPRRAALGATFFAALGGAAVIAAGVTAAVPLLTAAAVVYFFCLPLMAGSSQVVWQRTVPLALQGRVFATRAAIAAAAIPLASLVAGPLADRVFEPAMSPGGALAAAFGPLVGVGRGRGIALLLVAAGAASVLAALAAACHAPLRRLDHADVTESVPAPVGATV